MSASGEYEYDNAYSDDDDEEEDSDDMYSDDLLTDSDLTYSDDDDEDELAEQQQLVTYRHGFTDATSSNDDYISLDRVSVLLLRASSIQAREDAS